MSFIVVDRMLERIDVARGESVSALFTELMHTCEMVLKTTVLVTCAAIDDDRDRHRYGHLHALVRADSLGAWLGELDNMVVGPSAQYLTKDFVEIRALRDSQGSGSWQHEAATEMWNALRAYGEPTERIATRVDARAFLGLFVTLRNKTNGHGAVKSTHCAAVCPHLEKGLRRYLEGFDLFGREWAFLKKTLSDKYEVVSLSSDRTPFDHLATAAGREYRLTDGVYVHIGEPRRVELLCTDLPTQNMKAEEADFFLPNGKFKRGQFDVLSYVTGAKSHSDGSEYVVPPGQLAPSRTQGRADLVDVPAGYGTNLPGMPSGYVNRPLLEEELRGLLMESHRHRILTLVGRGGIGKTSMALSVLHELFEGDDFDRYGMCVWFSARDIDLLDDKPVPVRRHVLDQIQCAQYFAALVSSEASVKGFESEAFFRDALTDSPLGAPILFVFDNFETVKSPVDFFNWLDTYCRHPNKVVITTRHRDFKGDYPIEIGGLERDEYERLVNDTAAALGMQSLISSQVIADLYAQTGGHPYVTKIYLGESARAGAVRKPEMIMRNRDDILGALFERSFQTLSSPARRIFLTLCNWRSTVPVLAMAAVITSSSEEPIDAMAAISELKRSSLVEEVRPAGLTNPDEETSLRLPLEAALFGQKKLQVDPLKLRVELDTNTLQLFGAADSTAAKRGVDDRLTRLFKNLARATERDPSTLEKYSTLIDYLGRRSPGVWRMAADLCSEAGGRDGRTQAIAYLTRLLETDPAASIQVATWRRVAELARMNDDSPSELNAWMQIVAVRGASLKEVSDAANALNNLHYHHRAQLDREVLSLACERAITALAPHVESDATATDLSRLAWLYLNAGEREKAKTVTRLGLDRDPLNNHLLGLRERLGIVSDWDA